MYDKWSLEVLYSGFEDEKFLADFAAVDGKIAAYQAFADRIMHSYPQTDRKKTIEEMRKKLRVVQINRDGNLRAVTEIT